MNHKFKSCDEWAKVKVKMRHRRAYSFSVTTSTSSAAAPQAVINAGNTQDESWLARVAPAAAAPTPATGPSSTVRHQHHHNHNHDRPRRRSSIFEVFLIHDSFHTNHGQENAGDYVINSATTYSIMDYVIRNLKQSQMPSGAVISLHKTTALKYEGKH
jgi:hypothetical protein